MANYQDHVLDGASPVDLVVALYDGIIRFLYAAIAAAERGDVNGRRVAVKRARPAQVLSEFYASMFALILQASLAASPQRFEEVIRCVRNVRDAWRQVAAETSYQASAVSLSAATPHLVQLNPSASETDQASRWTA
jgi:flagellar secretion chaperone FliS